MHWKILRRLAPSLLIAALTASCSADLDPASRAAIAAAKPDIGDIVFTRIGGPIFANVAVTTGSWTSHVGIIVDYRDGDWIVAESGIPIVRMTPLAKFIGRSVGHQFAIERLKVPPTGEQKREILRFSRLQFGKHYALGFSLQSRGTFCSRFVHDVVLDATGQSIGETETFSHLLHRNPSAPFWFWRAWFLGIIPWQRTTITPASELQSPLLADVAQNHA